MGMTLACLFTLALPEAGQDPFFYAMVVPTQQKNDDFLAVYLIKHSIFGTCATKKPAASLRCVKCSLFDKT